MKLDIATDIVAMEISRLSKIKDHCAKIKEHTQNSICILGCATMIFKVKVTFMITNESVSMQ